MYSSEISQQGSDTLREKSQRDAVKLRDKFQKRDAVTLRDKSHNETVFR